MSGRPRRVGLVCPYDLDVPGGVREQVLGLAAALAGSGAEVSVLAPRGRAAPAVETVDGVSVRNAGRPLAVPTNGSTARLGVSPTARARAAAWADELATSGVDVVHVHEPIPPGVGHTVLRRLAARREQGRPGPAVVATVHVAMSPSPAGRSRSLRTASRHVGDVLRGVDVLTAVSEHARRTLVDHLGRVPLVVPNAVDVAGWGSAPPHRPDPAPTVVVVGRADEPRKGVDVLLRAWPDVREAVPDARLVVVGPSRTGHDRALPGVRFAGTVDEADKRALVAGADVLVAPHRGGESFGIVLVEAMAAGTAVVASDLPAFRDVLHGAGLLVPPGDGRALGAALVTLLAGEEAERRRATLVRDGRHRAEGYAWPVVTGAWQEVHALAVDVAAGPGAALGRLHRELRERADVALALADGTGPGAEALRTAALAARDPRDTVAQSGLTALVRSGATGTGADDDAVAVLAARTVRVRVVRALVNDLARRRGTPTIELDDDAGPAGTSTASWPWCPSLEECPQPSPRDVRRRVAAGGLARA